MEQVVFGRTGLRVGVAGLGCGGPSRLGQMKGASEAESIAVVQAALDLGVNYLDTAPAYGTEAIVGSAIRGRRSEVVLSTKVIPSARDGSSISPVDLRQSLEQSLKALGTDAVEVFHLHGVTDELYDECVARLLPELRSLRDEGLIRFIAISEQFGRDPGHAMLQRAVADDYWDVVMVGFSILNSSARTRVLPATIRGNLGVEVMFAVRRALSDRAMLAELVRGLQEDGLLKDDGLDVDDPLGFLVSEGWAPSVIDAAYRYVRHEPGCHVVLTGTGNVEHLRQNVASLNAPPLPEPARARLDALFGHLDHVTGN